MSTYDTDRILILGKGASVDRLSPGVFDNCFVIALNDAERITPADVTIFHDGWVAESIADNGFQSKAYLTSRDFEAPGATVVKLAYEPLGNDTADLMMSRLVDERELLIEEMMVLTALELAQFAATAANRTQSVYLLGFDFDPDSGYARAVQSAYQPETTGDARARLQMQEHFVRNAMYMLKDSKVEIVHVGMLDLSEMSPAGLNALLAPAPLYPGEEKVEAQPVLITAEVTTNHFGDRQRLERLIREASAAGADFVKFQKRNVDTFYTAEQLAAPYVSPFGSSFGDYRKALELDRDDFDFIDGLSTELGIGWFASVLDKSSFEYLVELEPAMMKLPSTISEHRDYLEYVANNYAGSLVLSTGMTDQAFEEWVLATFGDQQTLYLLHANSAYPTPQEHCNIGVVRRYSELSRTHPNIVPGYSSHDAGWMGSALAVAAGAGMVEKHVKLGNTEWAHFDAVAVDLTTTSFKEYVENVRRAQVLVGSPIKRVTASEHHKYTVAK